MLSKSQFLKKSVSFALSRALYPSSNSFLLQKSIKQLSFASIPSHYFSSFQSFNNNTYKDDLNLIHGLSREQLAYFSDIMNRYSTSQDLKAFQHEDRNLIASLLQHFAVAYKAQGNLNKAYSYIKEAEEIYKDQNIDDTLNVVNNHFIKASLCLNLNDFSTDIEYHFNEVDRICKILLHEPEARSLRVQNLLTRGDYHKRRGESDKALKLFNEILEKKDQVVDEVLPRLLISTYEELGFNYKSRGDLNKAVESWTKGLGMAILHDGENSTKVFFFYCDLAEILYQHRRFEEALPYINKGLQVALKIYPSNHWEIAWCNYFLGNVLSANGSRDKALETYKKAIKIYEMQSQQDFATLSDVYFKAAMINHGLGNHEEASLFFNKSAEILGKSSTPNMDDVYLQRASELKQCERLEEYETYLKRALEYCKKYTPPNKQKISKISSLLEELAAQKQ